MQGNRIQSSRGPENFEDNPFTNKQLYPVMGLVTSGFLDPYIQLCAIENRAARTLSDGTNVEYIFKQFANFVTESSKQLVDMCTYMNCNNMTKMKSMYRDICKRVSKMTDKMIDDPDMVTEEQKNNPEYLQMLKDHTNKGMFLKELHLFLSLPFEYAVNKFNSESNLCGAHIDLSRLVCFHKKYGIIRSPFERSYLLRYEEEKLIYDYIMPSFKHMNTKLGINADAVFVEYVNIVVTLNDKPIGLLVSTYDDSNPYRKNSVDYFNSHEIRSMIEDGFIGNLFNTDDFNDDDDDGYDDDFEGDDDDDD